MPELPEVHTTARILDELVSGLTITDTWTDYKSAFHTNKDNIKDPRYFARVKHILKGAAITSVTRRAKNVLIHLSNSKTLLVHMKMTGHLLYGRYGYSKKDDIWRALDDGPLQDPFNQWIHFVLSLSNGHHLVLSDLRKFAKVTLVDGTELSDLERSAHLADIGPEPLEESFDESAFMERLLKRPNAPVKLVMMDPAVVAGIGNIYSDEILWKAGIHPKSKSSKIPKPQQKKMFEAMKEILAKGIDFGGDSTSDYRDPYGMSGTFHYHHQAYRQTGELCPKRGCSGSIVRLAMGGRGAHFCPVHQTLYE